MMNECFKWCVTRAVYPTDKNPQRITKELIEQSKNFNWDGINFPSFRYKMLLILKTKMIMILLYMDMMRK